MTDTDSSDRGRPHCWKDDCKEFAEGVTEGHSNRYGTIRRPACEDHAIGGEFVRRYQDTDRSQEGDD